MNPILRGEGAYLAKRFQPVRQKEELVGATLLRLSRTNESFLYFAKDWIQNWGL